MKILNAGVETAKHDTQEIHEALQAERGAVLAQVRELQLATRLLVQAEARRLAARNPADSRVALLAGIERTARERIAVLDTELEVAAIRVPPVTRTDALVHGRITDEAQRAAGRVTVALVREDGKPVEGVAPVEVDDAGYYAFVIDPQAAAGIGADARLNVAVSRGSATVVSKTATGFKLASGSVAVKDVPLDEDELKILQLRTDLAAAAPTRPRGATGTTRKTAPRRGGAG